MIIPLMSLGLMNLALMNLGGLFTDQRQLGATVLILVAAAFVGVAVSRLVPRDRGPTFFGVSSALILVAALAYAGVEAAGLALWLLLALAIFLGVFALIA